MIDSMCWVRKEIKIVTGNSDRRGRKGNNNSKKDRNRQRYCKNRSRMKRAGQIKCSAIVESTRHMYDKASKH